MARLEGRVSRWRRLLWPGLLALAIHLLVLMFVRPPPAPAEQATLLGPLVYSALPAAPQAPQTGAPRPPVRRARPRAPSPVPPVVAPVAIAAPAPETPASAPAPDTPTPAPAPPEAAPPPPQPAVEPPLAPEPRAPALPPGSVRLLYTLEGELSGLAYQARGELLWKHDGQHYEARMEVGAFLLGSRVQSSRGRLTPAGLQPLRFVDRVRSDRSAEFDHDKQEIRLSEDPAAVPLPAGAQDQLSVFVQLGSLIGAAPQRHPAGTVLALPAVGVYGPETWRFVVGSQDELNLPGGPLAGLKLTREPTRPDEPRAEIWLAPSMGWLPARIRLSQPNGDYIDQRWRSSEAP
jgi:hypothetical protein